MIPRALAAAWCLFAALAAMLLPSPPASAQPAGVPVVVERLQDDGEPPTAAEVMHGAAADRFVREPYAAITPSRTHAVWYRLSLADDWTSHRPPMLSIFDPRGLSLTAYLPPAYQPERHSLYDPAGRDGFSRHALVVSLPSTLKAGEPIYVEVAPERVNPRGIVIADVLDARIADLANARMDVLFPAIKLATVLIMLSFFVVLRERMYAYFVGYSLASVVNEIYAFGIGYEIPPFDLLSPLRERPVALAAALSALLLIAFSRLFLELPRFAPRLDRMLGAMCWLLAAGMACVLLPGQSLRWLGGDVVSLLILVMSLLLIVAGVVGWQHGGRRGGYYLCAWLPGLLLMMARVLQLKMGWPMPAWLDFALSGSFTYANLVLSFALADHTLSIRHERDVAHRLAEYDALTGVLNRRAILARLRAAFADAREGEAALTVLFLDLDHFKHINDSHGHRTGDQCLRGVVAPIAAELRQGDALGRYGGEEFLVVLPGATAANGGIVAERIRTRVQEMPMLVSGTRVGLTISVGVASLEDGMSTPEDLIERADAALYRSKSNGRNKVTMHDGTPPVADDLLGHVEV